MTPASTHPLLIDVVVPTYRRPELLDRCLRALAVQQRQEPLTSDVGRFRLSGRLTGMHHLGTAATGSGPRELTGSAR